MLGEIPSSAPLFFISFELRCDEEMPAEVNSFFEVPFFTIPISLTKVELATFPGLVLVGNPFYYIFAGLLSLINDLYQIQFKIS